jgi:hypothetical protein
MPCFTAQPVGIGYLDVDTVCPAYSWSKNVAGDGEMHLCFHMSPAVQVTSGDVPGKEKVLRQRPGAIKPIPLEESPPSGLKAPARIESVFLTEFRYFYNSF